MSPVHLWLLVGPKRTETLDSSSAVEGDDRSGSASFMLLDELLRLALSDLVAERPDPLSEELGVAPELPSLKLESRRASAQLVVPFCVGHAE